MNLQHSPPLPFHLAWSWLLNVSSQSNIKLVCFCGMRLVRQSAQHFKDTVSHSSPCSTFPFPLLFTLSLPTSTPIFFPSLPVDRTPVPHSLFHSTPRFFRSLISGACQSVLPVSANMAALTKVGWKNKHNNGGERRQRQV